jgi:hypothetical protein
MFVEEPSWFGEAYAEPINIYDTGIIARNISFSQRAAIIIYFLFNKGAKFLDYAGGYGIFTRLMRDIGFDFYWHDPYSTNLMARGFEIFDGTGKFELVTCFEVLEHLPNPIEEIEKIFNYSDSILFSTTLLPSPMPKPGEWSYYGTEHGQHVSFYSLETLEFIAKKFGCNLYGKGDLYLLTKRTPKFLLFDLFMKFSRNKAFAYVKRHMKSRTTSDSETLARMNRQELI